MFRNHRASCRITPTIFDQTHLPTFYLESFRKSQRDTHIDNPQSVSLLMTNIVKREYVKKLSDEHEKARTHANVSVDRRILAICVPGKPYYHYYYSI